MLALRDLVILVKDKSTQLQRDKLDLVSKVQRRRRCQNSIKAYEIGCYIYIHIFCIVVMLYVDRYVYIQAVELEPVI